MAIPHACLLLDLSHAVQGRASLEPGDLALVEGVVDLEGEALTVSLGNLDVELGAGSELVEAKNGDLVGAGDTVVICRVREGEGEETLLLEVGLVDACEAASDHSNATEMTGLESSVLTGRALTIVLITNDDPLDTLGLVLTGHVGDAAPGASELVLDLVDLAVLGIDSADKKVVGDVVEVTTVLEPRTSSGDVVGGALTLGLDEDGGVEDVLAVPLGEHGEELEAVRLGVDINGKVGASILGRGGLVGVLTSVEALGGEGIGVGRSELHLLIAVSDGDGVRDGIELESTGEGESGGHLRGADEGVGEVVAVVTTSEVTVVRGNNCVLHTLGDVLTVPLTNARAASVGENGGTSILEGLLDAITGNGSANLLRAGGDVEGNLELDASLASLLDNLGAAAEILVRGVGARANKTSRDSKRPASLLGVGTELINGVGEIGGEGAVDLGNELREVDLDDLVVLSVLIGAEEILVSVSLVGNAAARSGLEVVTHRRSEGEKGGGGTNLSTHVANGSHTSARDGLEARSKVLNNGTSAALDCEDTGELADDILGGSPARELTSELHTNNLGGLELPRNVGHDIDGISTTDTDGAHAEATSVGGVGVSANHHATGEGVVLEDNLVDNTRTRVPEAHAVLSSGGGKEVVHLGVLVLSDGEILLALDLGLNEVIAVDGGGDSSLGETRGNELKDGHLCSSILHSNAIGAKLEIRLATNDGSSILRVVKVAVNNLFSVGQRLVHELANNLEVASKVSVRESEMGLMNAQRSLARRRRKGTNTSFGKDALHCYKNAAKEIKGIVWRMRGCTQSRDGRQVTVVRKAVPSCVHHHYRTSILQYFPHKIYPDYYMS